MLEQGKGGLCGPERAVTSHGCSSELFLLEIRGQYVLCFQGLLLLELEESHFPLILVALESLPTTAVPGCWG